MIEHDWLTEKFEDNRGHLQAVAYRMLGSLTEADDAVQEAWLRFHRADTDHIENLGGWLTTVVARVCLDMLRTRKVRREESLGAQMREPIVSRGAGTNPEDEALLAESVGLALIVVLETLSPAERLAFVLHDMFAVPFEEIAPIMDRSPTATRQLASRARRRVQGGATVSNGDIAPQRKMVDAFLSAARNGDFNALLTMLDPDVVVRDNRVVLPRNARREIRGAAMVASEVIRGGARAARPALVNGRVGVIVAPRGRLLLVLELTFTDGKISAVDVFGRDDHLRQIDLAVLDN